MTFATLFCIFVQMNAVDIIGVVREHRWQSADAQAKQLRASGCSRIVTLGGGSKRLPEFARKELLRAAREGTTFRLVYAFLLYDPKKRGAGAARDDLEATVDAIVRKGAAIECLFGELTTAKPGQRTALVAMAREMIGRDKQGAKSAANGKRQKGRQLVEFTKEQIEKARTIWRDTVEYPTWPDARKALAEIVTAKGEKFTADRAHKLWPLRKSKRR